MRCLAMDLAALDARLLSVSDQAHEVQDEFCLEVFTALRTLAASVEGLGESSQDAMDASQRLRAKSDEDRRYMKDSINSMRSDVQQTQHRVYAFQMQLDLLEERIDEILARQTRGNSFLRVLTAPVRWVWGRMRRSR